MRQVVERTGLSPTRQRGAFASVYHSVHGYSTLEGHFSRCCSEAGMTQDEYLRG
jgi:hypothetical protein